MFIICGLGNPGKDYNNTRHNVGFRLVNKIIENFNFDKIKENKSRELYAGSLNNIKIFILKPLTFMNLSGKPIMETVNFYKINNNNIFVIHDDLDLELAKVKIKRGGGNGGHNGLASIDEHLGENYYRIRIGINHPGHKDLVSNYVLSNFTKEEDKILELKIKQMIENFELLFSDIPLFLNNISSNS